MNKKGQIGIMLTVGTLIVIGVILLMIFIAGGLLINFLIKNIFFIIGGAVIVVGLIVGLKSDKKNAMKTLGIIVLIGIGIMAMNFLGIQQTVISGYTALTISNVQYDGADRIRIYGVANGAEKLSITFTPSQLNSYLNQQGYAATKTVDGTIVLSSQSVDFNILKDTDKNFLTLTNSQVGLLDRCENHVPSGYTYFSYSLELTKKNCIYYAGIGTYSTFTGRHIINSRVDVNIGGSTRSLTPSTGNNVLTLNDGKTSIEWTGDLNNYNQITSPFQYAALFQDSQYKKLIDSTAWNSYQNEVNKYQTCMGQAIKTNFFSSGILLLVLNPSSTTITSCTTTFNNRVNTLLIDKTMTYKNSIGSPSTSFTSNALKVSLKTPTTFPTFIITLDASKVGIIPLKGTPKIVSCIQIQNINSGDTSHPTLSVQNTGTSAGSFYGNIQCSGGASGAISENYFNAGETKNLPVTVTGQNIQSGTSTSTCTATVIDRKSGAQDACGFSVRITYQSGIVCTANGKVCIDDKTLRTCSADGKTFSDSKCENGCLVSQSGVSACKTDGTIIITAPQLECNQKALDFPLFGYEWVDGTSITSCGLNPLCWAGIMPPTITTEPGTCKPAFLVYWVVTGVVLVLGIAAIFILKKPKSRRK